VRVLHLDIISGISGDMTLGALVHLGFDLEGLREALGRMGLDQVRICADVVRPQGIGAVRFSVACDAAEHHPHRSHRDIRRLLQQAHLTPGAHSRAEAMFGKLAQAEGKIHGMAEDEVVFHELGAVDSIADIVGCAMALDRLGLERITSSPPILGRGFTQSQHGVLPVPAPATLEVLCGVPTRGGEVEGEMTTPTGAVILATQVNAFGPWPDMVVRAIGYGAGTKTFPDRPNVLRLVLGEASAEPAGQELLVEVNIDNMIAEHFEHIMERLFAAGAHDVWFQPIIMKKSRPAVTLSVLCGQERLEDIELVIFRESTTIGVRHHAVTRRKLSRHHEEVATPFGTVRVKVSGEGGEVFSASPEYEDCRARATEHQVPLKAVAQAAMDGYHGKRNQ